MKKSVFVFFWLPYAAKYTYHTFLTAFYIAVNRFPAEQCIHIGPTALFEPPLPGFADWLKGYGCRLPSLQELSSLSKRTIDPAVFDDVQQQLLSNNLVWKHLLTQRHAGLENELSRILIEISSAYKIEAIVAWGNTPSLSRVAQHHGLKVIHHEMGPLRSPSYVHTAYFDFSGVNGNTEASSRFTDFKNNTDANQLKTLSLKALLSIFGEEQYFGEIFKAIPSQFDIGVPLQVEDDSNILAFSNGFNNYEVIAFARSHSNQVLIRKHPFGHADYFSAQDDSKSVIEFIKRVSRIITINSSIGFEAMLYGKSCQVLGDSPFTFIANPPKGEPDNNLLVAINFFLFGYLIPFKLLFDCEYYRWRLGEPSEIEIYNFHLDYYFKNRGLPAPAGLSPDQLEAEALTRSQRALANLTGTDWSNSNTVGVLASEHLEGESNTQSGTVAASSRFISYAQNFEDVMLWRAFKHVQNGFYIDVGAQDPVIDSVSLAFYERGWRGVHVEPSTLYAEKIRRARPDEILIQAAVGSEGGVLRFYEIADTGLSTGDPQLAEKHREAGYSVREIDVPRVTLVSILDRYSDRDIHWLKIDVEGMESEVLQGWLPSLIRPWVVVIESTIPLTQAETHDKWEPLLLELGYDFIYFDGLNRFYLSKAHLELKDAFRFGPNVFDEFVLSGTSSAPFCRQLMQRLHETQQETQRLSRTLTEQESELAQSRKRFRALEMELIQLRNATVQMENRIGAREAELATVYHSLSWRLTAPLRLPRRAVRRALLSALTHLRARPARMAVVTRLLVRFPRLLARLKAFAWTNKARFTIASSAPVHNTLAYSYKPTSHGISSAVSRVTPRFIVSQDPQIDPNKLAMRVNEQMERYLRESGDL